jgi:hypothetical protein
MPTRFRFLGPAGMKESRAVPASFNQSAIPTILSISSIREIHHFIAYIEFHKTP